MLAIWLREQGFDVITTREPGATKVGMRLRALLLDTAHAGMSARAEALMYAADRAEHVASVIDPALARGAVVITQRHPTPRSPTRAPPGACGARTSPAEPRATGGLTPDLTILLDLAPLAGLDGGPPADRLEAEPTEFHEPVRPGSLPWPAASPGVTSCSTRPGPPPS